uniref:Uncharacterized protein n=1 Tax=Lutzomyia longipalpis TaxID=7200 RepID=A0A1B0GL35_LUTLO
METDHINNNNHERIVKKPTKALSNLRTKWNLKSTAFAESTINPIRAIVEGLKFTPNPEKQMIPLSIGKFFHLSTMLIMYINLPASSTSQHDHALKDATNQVFQEFSSKI